MVRLAAVAFGLLLTASPLYAQETLFTVTVSFANIHAGASTTSPILAAAPRGRSFEVTRELKGWVAIAWPAARNGVGYLHSSWGELSLRRAADVPLLNHVPSAIPSFVASFDSAPSLSPDLTEAEDPPAVDVPVNSPEPAAPTTVPDTPATAPDTSATAPDTPATAPDTQAAATSDTPASAAVDTPATAPPSSSVRADESPVAELVGAGSVPSSEGADSHGYSVQVAALRDLEEARTLSERLSQAGYPAYLTTATVNHVQFHRVRVGPFQARQAAREVAQRLETQGYQAPWITR